MKTWCLSQNCGPARVAVKMGLESESSKLFTTNLTHSRIGLLK
ncbi:hypothetical protein [Rubritalea tangerina]